MPSVAKPFTANIPHFAEDSNNGQLYLVGDIVVEAVAYVNDDGSVKCVDINTLMWKGKDVTMYVYECLPGTWERLIEATKASYLPLPNVAD